MVRMVPFFMMWNTVLAVVPLVLALWLFRPDARTGAAGWWCGLGAFVVTLPNAPYVLTDVIHLVDDAQDGVLIRTVLAYLTFFVVGVVAYTVSVVRFGSMLRRTGIDRAGVVALEVVLHALVAVGVLVGRYGRWNSWDLGVRPVAVVTDTVAWLSPRAVVAVTLLAVGLIAITTTVRLAARGFVVTLRSWRVA